MAAHVEFQQATSDSHERRKKAPTSKQVMLELDSKQDSPPKMRKEKKKVLINYTQGRNQNARSTIASEPGGTLNEAGLDGREVNYLGKELPNTSTEWNKGRGTMQNKFSLLSIVANFNHQTGTRLSEHINDRCMQQRLLLKRQDGPGEGEACTTHKMSVEERRSAEKAYNLDFTN